MSLSDLPTLAEVQAMRAGRPIQKGTTRRDAKLARLTTEKKADDVARKKAWTRCEGRCEKCRKRVKRGGGLLDGAEFHHRIPRSKGGRKTPIYLVTCHGCHFDGPSGSHTRTR